MKCHKISFFFFQSVNWTEHYLNLFPLSIVFLIKNLTKGKFWSRLKKRNRKSSFKQEEKPTIQINCSQVIELLMARYILKIEGSQEICPMLTFYWLTEQRKQQIHYTSAFWFLLIINSSFQKKRKNPTVDPKDALFLINFCFFFYYSYS